ncbi:hypothetical protein QQ045_017601 [Rhodiola kirilowii]
MVSNAWAGQAHQEPLQKFGLKLKKLCGVLRTWNREVFGDINKRVKEQTLLVDKLESQLQHRWDDDLYDLVKDAKSELSNLLRYQFNILEEKAKLQWSYEGDHNSKFHHAAIKARRIQNTIRLTMVDRSRMDDAQVISQAAISHLQALFGAHPIHEAIEVDDLV